MTAFRPVRGPKRSEIFVHGSSFSRPAQLFVPLSLSSRSASRLLTSRWRALASLSAGRYTGLAIPSPGDPLTASNSSPAF